MFVGQPFDRRRHLVRAGQRLLGRRPGSIRPGRRSLPASRRRSRARSRPGRASAAARDAPSHTSSAILRDVVRRRGHLLGLAEHRARVERVVVAVDLRVSVLPCHLLQNLALSGGGDRMFGRARASARGRAARSGDRRRSRRRRRTARSVPTARRRADESLDSGTVRNSRQESTSRPTDRPRLCTTSSRDATSSGARSKPNRARMLIAGTTWPRENTTPSTNGGAFGTRVICSTISTCATSWLGSA